MIPYCNTIIVGNPGVGKTALLTQFDKALSVTGFVAPSSSFFSKNLIYIDGTPVNICLSASDANIFRGNIFMNEHAAVFVYDITQRITFSAIKRWKDKFESEKSRMYHTPVVLVGNKSDLDQQREVSYAEGAAYAEELGCPFFETSAKTGANVEEAIIAGARVIYGKKKPKASAPITQQPAPFVQIVPNPTSDSKPPHTAPVTANMFVKVSTMEEHEPLLPPAPLLKDNLQVQSAPLTPNSRSLGLMIPASQLEYNTDQALGLGSQGVAYRAMWKSKDVVFKQLFVRVQDSDKRAFLNELEVWRNIQHSNSVALYGAVDDAGKLGYVMEYCPNEYIKKGLVWSPTKIVDFTCKVADILSFLHSASIAHRDIKPANIMLDQEFRPKLGDYGLSRMLERDQASATNLAGTPTYMAPEQFIENAKHDPIKADIFSFGMLMYELATGKTPFDGRSIVEISRMVEKGERPPIPANMPIGMEEAERKLWWQMATKCWAQDPRARPPIEEISKTLGTLRKLIFERIQGFSCKAHKTGIHDYFLSYRVATELKQSISRFKMPSGRRRLAEELPFGLHHSKILIPIISVPGVKHMMKAHEENDNVLLEYEHMLELLIAKKGKVKVFPIFIEARPVVNEYPDRPHITTGKNIQQTLEGMMRLQGKRIKVDALAELIPAFLAKLEELETEVNTSLTLAPLSIQATTTATQPATTADLIEVFIQVEGEPPGHSAVEVSPSATLQVLRSMIADQLDDFEFEYKFIKKSGPRISVVAIKQEGIKFVKDVLDQDGNVTIQRA